MALSDRVKRLLGRGEPEEAAENYECTTCGRTFEVSQNLCPDCGGRVEELA